MPLSAILPVERVRVGLSVPAKGDLFAELATLLAGELPRTATEAALQARERLGSTGLGRGVAIPHGRSAEAGTARAAFVRLAEPIEFGADDGQPVDLVAALIVPAHFTDQHLRLLAELAELFGDPDRVRAMRGAADAVALHALLGPRPRD